MEVTFFFFFFGSSEGAELSADVCRLNEHRTFTWTACGEREAVDLHDEMVA